MWFFLRAARSGFVLSALVIILGGCRAPQSSPPGLPVVGLRVKGVEVQAEVASSPADRTMGLMFRHKLKKDHGMLFIFPEEAPRSFWMKNTYIPLSIAFLDAKGVILNIEDMEPRSEAPHYSRKPAKYALEMDKGWFKARDIGPGISIEGIPDVGGGS